MPLPRLLLSLRVQLLALEPALQAELRLASSVPEEEWPLEASTLAGFALQGRSTLQAEPHRALAGHS